MNEYKRLTKRLDTGKIAIPAPNGEYYVLCARKKDDIIFIMINAVIERLTELEDKRESGELMESSFKFGDKVYYIASHYGKNGFEYDKVGETKVGFSLISTDDIIYGYFATKEDAEARLKELQTGVKLYSFDKEKEQ